MRDGWLTARPRERFNPEQVMPVPDEDSDSVAERLCGRTTAEPNVTASIHSSILPSLIRHR